MDVRKYSITELARELGVSESVLRKYEKDYRLHIPRNDLKHRYYTDKEVEVFKQILKLKEQGLNKTTIIKILTRSVSAEEQKEMALELVTLDKITGKELKDLMVRQIYEIEKELTSQYEEKLELIRDEIRKEFQRQEEQRAGENIKLLDAIEKIRSEKKKSFWSKLFG